jgi:hypothetical protein
LVVALEAFPSVFNPIAQTGSAVNRITGVVAYCGVWQCIPRRLSFQLGTNLSATLFIQ